MSLPDNPWQLLGLDPKAASERDVKRAYARLLKLHRPDTDPEGFQKVHAAYQQALDELRYGREPDAEMEAGYGSEPGNGGQPAADLIVAGSEGDATEPSRAESGDGLPVSMPPIPEMPAIPDGPVLPPEFTAAAAGLLEELSRKPRPQEPPHFKVLRNVIRRDPGLASAWGETLMRSFSGPQELAPLMEPDDVLLLLDHGMHSLCADIVRAWRDVPGGRSRLGRLAERMLERARSGTGPAHPGAMHFLAFTTAFPMPEIAGRLADALFLQLAPGERERAVQGIELRAAAGRALGRLSQQQQAFWEERLFHSSEETVDWSTPESTAALRNLFALYPADWHGWAMIEEAVPEQVLEAFRQPPPVPATQATTRTRDVMPEGWLQERTGLERISLKRFSRRQAWFAWLGFLIFFYALKVFLSSPEKPHAALPPNTPQSEGPGSKRVEDSDARAADFHKAHLEREKAYRDTQRGVQPKADPVK